MAHSKLSNVWETPPITTSNALSYSLPHVSQRAIVRFSLRHESQTHASAQAAGTSMQPSQQAWQCDRKTDMSWVPFPRLLTLLSNDNRKHDRFRGVDILESG